MKMSVVAKYLCLECEDGIERSWGFLISHNIRKHDLPHNDSERAPVVIAAILDMNSRPGSIVKVSL